jgi:hypothetical protein
MRFGLSARARPKGSFGKRILLAFLKLPRISFIPEAIYQRRPQLISSTCAALSVPAVLASSGGFREAIQHF